MAMSYKAGGGNKSLTDTMHYKGEEGYVPGGKDWGSAGANVVATKLPGGGKQANKGGGKSRSSGLMAYAKKPGHGN